MKSVVHSARPQPTVATTAHGSFAVIPGEDEDLDALAPSVHETVYERCGDGGLQR
jgi:hypothetical protein